MTTIAVDEKSESTDLHGFWTRSNKVGLTFAIIGLAVIAVAILAVDSSNTVTLALDTTLGASFSMNATILVIVLGVLGIALGGVLLSGYKSHFGLIAGAGVFVFTFALLSLAMAPTGKSLPLEATLAGGVFLALPLIFGSLSGVICERSGVINVGIEGQFLAGAFLGAIVGAGTGSMWLGIIAACIAGALTTLLLAWLAINYRVDQVVVGVILNLLVLGLTGYLYDKFQKMDQQSVGVDGYQAILKSPPKAPNFEVPILSDIPIIGPAIFSRNIFTYFAIALVILIWVMLFHSKWGLRTRAVGEHPAAADTVGIKVNLLRYKNVIMAGLISGLGGAFLTIGTGLAFSKDMTAGKGFIALAVLIVGRWSPLGALAGALLFGFAGRIQEFLSSVGAPVPTEFLAMLPYIVTIVAVAGLIGRVRAPAADGQPYIKE